MVNRRPAVCNEAASSQMTAAAATSKRFNMSFIQTKATNMSDQSEFACKQNTHTDDGNSANAVASQAVQRAALVPLQQLRQVAQRKRECNAEITIYIFVFYSPLTLFIVLLLLLLLNVENQCEERLSAQAHRLHERHRAQQGDRGRRDQLPSGRMHHRRGHKDLRGARRRPPSEHLSDALGPGPAERRGRRRRWRHELDRRHGQREWRGGQRERGGRQAHQGDQEAARQEVADSRESRHNYHQAARRLSRRKWFLLTIFMLNN